MNPIRLAYTPGEPAGIGPDLLIRLAGRRPAAQLVAWCDPALIEQRARLLDIPVSIEIVEHPQHASGNGKGTIIIVPVPLPDPAVCGKPDPGNARAVLAALEQAVDACMQGQIDGLVTGPVHKGVINDAGIPFSGHTEFIAARTGTQQPVMMLASKDMRVALVTTHLPLADVPAAITADRLTAVIGVLHHDLRQRFGIPDPRILVCGLNPHAGEDGHLGGEEREIMIPVIERLRRAGIRLQGPAPADTAFTPQSLQQCDAVLSMYHDQGLPVIKHAGFGDIVNVTLGLPIVRTSVDHGTALELAGTGRARTESLVAAIQMAAELARRDRPEAAPGP